MLSLKTSAGLDTVYLVAEYPRSDVFESWLDVAGGLENPALRGDGVQHGDYLVRRGLLGYRLSVWDGDCRLLLTDRVNEHLVNTPSEGQGMGFMLQLGPKWLTRYGPRGGNVDAFIQNIYCQLIAFGVVNPSVYRYRLNTIDIRLDIFNLHLSRLSALVWDRSSPLCQWVGYAAPKAHYYGEGLLIGSKQGNVQLRIYDKIAQAVKDGDLGFWSSVWGRTEDDDRPVTRFEWSVRAYAGGFAGVQYLDQLTWVSLGGLVSYLLSKWGRIVSPRYDDSNRRRWEVHKLWRNVDEWMHTWFRVRGPLKRVYKYSPDLRVSYQRSFAGWLAGYRARLGLSRGDHSPSSLAAVIEQVFGEVLTAPEFDDLAAQKFAKWSVIAGVS